MKRYQVWLSDIYTENVLTLSWDYPLLPSPLKKEFDLLLREELDKIFKAKRRTDSISDMSDDQIRRLLITYRVLPSDLLKQFMLQKKINLVNDPVTKGLKSVFIIKKGEKKIVDEKQLQSLEKFRKEKKEYSDDTETSWLGFLEIEEVKEEKVVVVPKKKLVPTETKDGLWKCPTCDYENKIKIATLAHMRKHESKEVKDAGGTTN